MVPPLRQGFRRRKNGPYTIRIYHPLCGQYLTVKDFPVPEPPEIVTLESEKEEDLLYIYDISEPSTSKDHEFAHNVMSAEQYRITQMN
jgi:hypothetical protein